MLFSLCLPFPHSTTIFPRNYLSSSMAGLVLVVEFARRRGFHQSGASSGCTNFTRRSSLGLYSSNHEFLPSSSSLQQRSARSDESPAGAAGEAKERLDAKLRSAQMNSANKRQNIKETKKSREGRPDLHIEVYGSKKSRMMFNWRKLSWKAIKRIVLCA